MTKSPKSARDFGKIWEIWGICTVWTLWIIDFEGLVLNHQEWYELENLP